MLRYDRFRELRLQNHYTHEEMAEFLNVGTRQIARYESGENDPSGDIVSRSAQIFNVSADYLLGLTDDPTPSILIAGLSDKERALISAWRRGDVVEAMRTLIADRTIPKGA